MGGKKKGAVRMDCPLLFLWRRFAPLDGLRLNGTSVLSGYSDCYFTSSSTLPQAHLPGFWLMVSQSHFGPQAH